MTFWDQTLLELFKKGGFAMWPLLACSVIGTAIIIERALFFIAIQLPYQKFLSDLKMYLIQNNAEQAKNLCARSLSPIARMAGLYLKNLDQDALRNDILKREGSYALEQVETRLRGLAALTHVAPLLGLLGTVTGLVAAFHQIEVLGGQVQSGDLASGIWEALLTTVFGLVIAIPCMAAYHGFESQADRIARRMQFMIAELDEYFGKKTSGGFKIENPESDSDTMDSVQ